MIVVTTASPDWTASTVFMLNCLVERLVCTFDVLINPDLPRHDTFIHIKSYGKQMRMQSRLVKLFQGNMHAAVAAQWLLTPKVRCSCNLKTRLQLHTGPRPLQIAR